MARNADAPETAEGRGPDRRLRSRRLLTKAVTVLTVGAVFVTLLRLSGWDRGWISVPLVAYTPYVAAGALAVAVIAAMLRRWRHTAVLLVVTVVLGALVLPRAFPSEADSGSGGPLLRVMALNVQAGGVDPADIEQLVRDRDVDVLALQETTPELREGLTEVGLDTQLPHTVDQAVPGVGGSSIHSIYPLTEIADLGGRFAMPHVRVDMRQRQIELVSVHPPPPMGPANVQSWREALRSLPEADPDGPVRILAGDFNATPDNGELRSLRDTGYIDAADEAGAGLTGTWPVGRPLPKVTIDHVLVDSRAGIGDVEVFEADGTDHRGLFVRILLPEE